jgi:protein tyrosine phosphatase (PTP) superfamily phosphohydrolase (DUF442 family)
VIQDPRLARIPNLRCIDAALATGGQPDADGLTAVVCSGYGVVVNLGLDDASYALADEAAIVRELGADYHHLPVSFEAPTREDLMHFVELMDHLQGHRVFVHCALNKRVSVMVAVYSVWRGQWDISTASAFVSGVWSPDAVWQALFDSALARRRD